MIEWLRYVRDVRAFGQELKQREAHMEDYIASAIAGLTENIEITRLLLDRATEEIIELRDMVLTCKDWGNQAQQEMVEEFMKDLEEHYADE